MRWAPCSNGATTSSSGSAAGSANAGATCPPTTLRRPAPPGGGEPIPNSVGTAPGLKCMVGDKIVYAVPGVPYEMRLMMGEHILPDLRRRAGQHGAIVSRTLKTWGASESGLAEMVADPGEA